MGVENLVWSGGRDHFKSRGCMLSVQSDAHCARLLLDHLHVSPRQELTRQAVNKKGWDTVNGSSIVLKKNK